MGILGFFNKSKNNKNIAVELLEKHDAGKMNDMDFLRDFKGVNLYFSTPFGDHKDGGTRLFLLPGPEETGYFPIFSSDEKLTEFYKNAGRPGYLVLQGTFLSILKTTKSSNESDAPVKMGIIIDPGYFNVTVDAAMLDTVIDMYN